MRLIDADNAISVLEILADKCDNRVVWEQAIAVLKDVPTIEVEPKHGRWKPFDLTWGRSIYACTNCEEAFEVPTQDGKPIYDYCPNCGARMDEVKE